MGFNDLFRKKTVQDIMQQVAAGQADDAHGSLGKHLKVRDLAAFGIAAIIGAGIFSTIGEASSQGGPAVIFLFLFTAIACGFAAFAYAEFASMVPVSGSAYTYSYVAFGEIIAWIIGWALIMEYAIGNIVVAISWSGYFTNVLSALGIYLPTWLVTDPKTAHDVYLQVVHSHGTTSNLAWTMAPHLGNLKLIFNLPAFLNSSSMVKARLAAL